MPAQDSEPKSRFSPRWSPRSWTIFLDAGALVSAALLLVLSGAAPAAEEGPQAEPIAGSEPGERPAWLRPLGDDASFRSEPGGEPAPTEGGQRRAGWSELEPGVLDVQAWDWLQQDLVRMIDETQVHAPNRLSPSAFGAKFVGATVEFLEIDAEETRTFQTAVNKALNEIDGARAEMRRREPELDLDETAAMHASRVGWEEYTRAQHHAVRFPLAVLQARPRHQLLGEAMLAWLLRLDYGMGAAAR